MLEIDGLDATRQIIELPYHRVVRWRGCRRKWPPPIGALTANASPEDREQYLGTGLDDYLAKPFEREVLAAVLEKWTQAPIGRVKLGASVSVGSASCA